MNLTRRIVTLTLLGLVLAVTGCSKHEFTNPVDLANTVEPVMEIAVQQLTLTTCRVSWSYSSSATGFRLDIKRGGDDWTAEHRFYNASVREHIETGIIPGQMVAFRVFALADQNSSSYIEAQTLMVFPAPGNVSIIRTSINSCELHWYSTVFGGETGYSIDRKLGDAEWENNYRQVSAAQLSLAENDLPLDTTIHYRIKTRLNEFCSPASETSITMSPIVPTPIIDPAGGGFLQPCLASISCSLAGSEIRYTLNGDEPSLSSPIYVSQIYISVTSQLKARAYKTGYYPSEVSTASFDFDGYYDNMVYVTGGQFTMGNESGHENEAPVHEVTLRDYLIGVHEVTQFEWIEVMGSNPSHWPAHPEYPVETLNWYDTIAFCNRKSLIDGLTPVYSIHNSVNPDLWGVPPSAFDAQWNAVNCNWSANGYRLPTEAEWEFAARGGNLSHGYNFSGSISVGVVAWYESNSQNHTHQIMTKAPNELGIYDMSGNVWEYCWDWYGSYSASSQVNPTGPSTGTYRVSRGGSWCNDGGIYGQRVSARLNSNPYDRNYTMGMRLARSVEPGKQPGRDTGPTSSPQSSRKHLRSPGR